MGVKRYQEIVHKPAQNLAKPVYYGLGSESSDSTQCIRYNGSNNLKLFQRIFVLYSQLAGFVYFRMIMFIRLLIILFLLARFPAAVAQQSDEQLATMYFSNAEFDKAAGYYEKLNAKNPASVYFYDNLLQCYFNMEHFDDAEKLVKRQQKKFGNNAYYKVDQGYVYKKSAQFDKANKLYTQVIDNLKGDEPSANETANAFRKRDETALSIKTFLVARKLNGSGSRVFALELAQLYATTGHKKGMIDEYMSALSENPLLIEDVQGYLQLYLEDARDYDMLRAEVVRLNKEYSGDIYSEMLIWLYVQRKDFENAFLQTKALDKRNKENGLRIFNLANIAMQSGNYDAAISIYNYLLSLGKEHVYYVHSQMGLLEARNRKITLTTDYTLQDLKLLESEYVLFLKRNLSLDASLELARLEVNYLHNYDTAIIIYNDLVGTSERTSSSLEATAKLELGDLYVLKGEVWEAALLYGQVDKDYKEHPLGQEAKFRNAKLSYYMGEFEWARGQLDVLKTATSQLISNNALELSLLIQYNTFDSNDEPLLMFAKADLNFYQDNEDAALRILDSLKLLYPRHSLDDDILLKRAEIYARKRDFAKSISYLEQLLREHGSDILGDNALFMQADITENKLHDKVKALQLYEKFIADYPGSFFLTEVRLRYRLLRGDNLN